ncbi:MAG: glycosyltransferase [Pseudomonadota bacterium]
MPSSVDDKIVKPLRIVIPAPSLTSTGGIQNFVAGLASYLARQGHYVCLFTPSKEGTTPRFSYDTAVHFVQYNSSGLQKYTVELRKKIIEYAPDVVIAPYSTAEVLVWCAALKDTNIPLLYSEHNDPWIIMQNRWSKTDREAVLWAADGIHTLMPNFVDSIPESCRQKTRPIYNPLALLLDYSTEAVSTPTENCYTLLSLGRLTRIHKQIHLLIAAFAMLAQEFPQWKLDIWGIGSDEKNLQKQIAALPQEFQERVRLCGLAKTPTEQYSTADIFCIPSRFEGFGLTITEAMIHGVPVVGFADCSGVNGLVHHEENGLLAPEMTPESLAGELRRLMEDTQLRQSLGQQAKDFAEGFRPERIYPQWEELIYKTAACKGRTRLSLIDSEDIPENERPYQATMRKVLERPNVVKDIWYRRRLRQWIRKQPQSASMINALLRKLNLAIID